VILFESIDLPYGVNMKLNEKQTKVFTKLHRALNREGYEIRLVGGAVRDIMQGKEPKDLDFATDALPGEVIKHLGNYLIHTIPTGIKHGTVTAIVEGETVEITTLRVDAETDGRHAEVVFTDSWEEDARRRDLTINAMSMDYSGTVHDYFGGKEDLREGHLRFVGDTRERVREDYLRILRYFRFASHLDKLTWDYDTLEILKEEASGLEKISGERIWTELNKIMSGNLVYNVTYAMDAYNILQAIGFKQRLEFSTYWEFLKLSEMETKPSSLLFICALLRDHPELETVRDRWKFDNHSFKIMSYVIQLREMDIKLYPENIEQKMLRGEEPHLLYFYAQYTQNYKVMAALEEYKNKPLPKFPITGNDLKSVGVEAGPKIGSLLSSLKDDWIKSGYKLTKEELLNDATAANY